MRKIVILISFLILFSGCTIDYDVVIKDNDTIFENSKINIKDVKNDKEFSEVKKDFDSEYSTSLIKKRYEYEIKNIDNKAVFSLYKRNILKGAFKNSLYNYIYEDSEMFSSGNIVYFKTVGNNYLGNLFVTKNYEEGLSFDKKVDTLRINISFENKVISHNADKVDEDSNTYTWIFTKDNYKKNIIFSYDSSTKVRNIEDNHVKKNNNQNNNKDIQVKHLIVIVSGLVICIAIVLLSVFVRNKRINEI